MLNRLSAFTAASGLICAVMASAPVKAAENTWACEVMLCASNPGGWMQFSQCVPPIKKLISHLALGGGFPTCTSAGVRGAKYAKPKDGRPGFVVMTMSDGSRTSYVVPSNAQVAQAEVSAQTVGGASLGLAQ
jgi:hypothetical protein